MARAALGWTTHDLARAAGVGLNTVNRFEAGQDARISTTAAIRSALDRYVEFIPANDGGPGVKLKSPRPFGGEARMMTLAERAQEILEQKSSEEHRSLQSIEENSNISRDFVNEIKKYCAERGQILEFISHNLNKVTIRNSGFHAEIVVNGENRYDFTEFLEVPRRRKGISRQKMLDEVLRFLDLMRGVKFPG